MAARHEDSAVARFAPPSQRLPQGRSRHVAGDVIEIEAVRDELIAALPTLTKSQGLRLWEEAVQPLTVIVARAEMIGALLQEGDLGDVPEQLDLLHQNAERLLSQIASTRRAFRAGSAASA